MDAAKQGGPLTLEDRIKKLQVAFMNLIGLSEELHTSTSQTHAIQKIGTCLEQFHLICDSIYEHVHQLLVAERDHLQVGQAYGDDVDLSSSAQKMTEMVENVERMKKWVSQFQSATKMDTDDCEKQS